MLIHEGELRFIGDPEEAARRYTALNFGDRDDGRGRASQGGSAATWTRA